jgi:RNA polymerase sigma-70 factor (ECF subfamily)
LIEGDEGRFQKFTAFREDVFRVCLGLTRNLQDAEDLCQCVFLKAFSKQRDLRNPESAKIWLLRIARTTCLDYLRKNQRRAAARLEMPAVPNVAPPRPDPAAAAGPALRRIKEAVLCLPRRQREVFVLREYGDLSYETMASVLKTRPGTIMSRLSRARRAVAEAVREEET